MRFLSKKDFTYHLFFYRRLLTKKKKTPATQAAQWYGRGKLQNDDTSTLVSVSVTISGSVLIGKNHSFGMYILETRKKIKLYLKILIN